MAVSPHRSFVVADIPGLIEGASAGAGLGVRFLKHLARTRLLLHVVDVAPPDPAEDPVEAVRGIERELREFSADLRERERWLVLNKVDLMPEEEREAHCQAILRRLDWQGPYFVISALSGLGVRPLCERIMSYLESRSATASEESTDAG